MNDSRTAYTYARILLGVSVGLSLACNAAHAYLNAAEVPIPLALGVGTIPPLVLALSVEAVIFCARSARWAWGWVAVTFAAGTGLVTGFAMSFAAISDLGRMARMTAITAPMLPIGIDALVITGLGMVALFRPKRIAVSVADQVDDQEVDHAARFVERADRVADRPELAAEAPIIPAVQTPRSGDSAPVSEPVADSLSEPADEQPRALEEGTDPRTDHRQIAERIAASGGTQQRVEVIAAVLAARAEGLGQRAAGSAAGVSQGAVRTIERIRDDLESETAIADDTADRARHAAA